MAEPPRDDASLPSVPTGTHPWVAQWADRIGFGVSIFPHPPDWQGFIRLVQRMEKMGIDSYWSYDHPAANADCWTALAALAVTTERIRLGTMVDCIYYRSPYLLARQAASTIETAMFYRDRKRREAAQRTEDIGHDVRNRIAIR